MMKTKIIKYRWYPSYRYNKLELWLKDMSDSGWMLVNYGSLKYEFKKCNNVERIYFAYNCGGFRNEDGQYSVMLRYPLLKEQYGISTRRSLLNKNNRSRFFYKTIIELDPQKVDDGFYEIIDQRNKLYIKQLIMNVIYMLLIICCYLIAILL